LPYSDASQSGVIPLAYTFSKPVIVSKVGSLQDYIEHGKTGFLFDKGNAKQLAYYIMVLIENSELSKKMGENGYKKMLAEMSVEKCCKIINDLYNRDS